VISTAWAGGSRDNYKSMLWARIFQGIATAPFEALVNASVGDLYFVHVCDNIPQQHEESDLMCYRNVASAWH
jgi:hypothetical protein